MPRQGDLANSLWLRYAFELKLLTVNYELPPQGGGAGVVMLDLINALRAVKEVKQTALCAWDYRLGAAPQLAGVDFKLVPVARKNIHQAGIRAVCEFLWRGGRVLRALDPASYDVIHFHFSIPTGLLAAFRRQKPFVCSLHGIDVPGFVEEGKLLQKLLAPANTMVLNTAKKIFVPNHTIAQIVRQRCARATVEVIPHGVNVELFSPKEIYPKCARRFVTVARLAPWKRVGLLVQAIIELHKSVDGVTLDIFGDGEQLSEIETVVRNAGAAQYIRLRGFTPKENLQKTLRMYDAFALPSVSEAFGLVYVEAMAAGLPVIGFNYGGPAEIITADLDGILTNHDSVSALLEALTRLATTAGLAERLGKNARRTAIERFSWTRISERYLAAYEEAVQVGA
jgi:teichuronic acid biosynthesis glycosyltransferase TuaC